jgi:hypothetical protein
MTAEPVRRELPCRTKNPDFWFDGTALETALAILLCQGCPIRQNCLNGALERGESYGIWGGRIITHGKILSEIPTGIKQAMRIISNAESLLATIAELADPETGLLKNWSPGQILVAWNRQTPKPNYSKDLSVALVYLSDTGRLEVIKQSKLTTYALPVAVVRIARPGVERGQVDPPRSGFFFLKLPGLAST